MIDQCSAEDLLLDNQLCFVLYATSKATIQAYRTNLDKLGVTYPQYLVFMVLWEEDKIPLKRLGERLYLDSGTLTPLLKRLEKEGFFYKRTLSKRRTRDPNEAHQKDQELQKKAKPVPRTMMCAVDVEDEGLIKMRDQLKNLLARLQKIKPESHENRT